ncbi:zinc finger matrin-type protein [Thalictrum thalictroides]|uniref:Zinc finger matrin-type protein n=1 Tax=Thalictrum thalictroides TaxID=46969 RepID=A0A7J6WTR2_THATH|nr:zinc finger matrin-type protein [Thalictrum thalictroides]
MISLFLRSTPTSSLLSIKLPDLLHQPLHFKAPSSIQNLKQRKKHEKNRDLKCRAELLQDAPFAVAIGASMLNSLVFPIPKTPDDDNDDSGSAIDSTDARFAVMGIISFVPYFNWLSWIFAWLDTGSPRYAVYSIIYLAPYIRTNLSLSPDESWLPIASIIFCIIHIQLEASIRNRDLQGFQLFRGADDSQGISKKEKKQEHEKLPSAQEHPRSELHGWGISEKPLDEHLEERDDANE